MSKLIIGTIKSPLEIPINGDNLFVITETLFDGIREDEILALRQ